MVNIPPNVESRIKSQLRKYKRILETAQSKDINESDTVMIISDILKDLFGYDKYSEITTEFSIKGQRCDLAVKSGDTVHYLIEAKAIGIELKEQQIYQATNYAFNSGIDWVVLTNGMIWNIYKVVVDKPVSVELLKSINFFDPIDSNILEALFMLTKEGVKKSAITEFQEKQQAINIYTIAALLQNDCIVNAVRKELRKIYPGVKIDTERVQEIISNEVIKREALAGERAELAKKQVRKYYNKIEREEKKELGSNTPEPAVSNQCEVTKLENGEAKGTTPSTPTP